MIRLVLLILVFPVLVEAQTPPIKNPTGLQSTVIPGDHAQATAYEIDFWNNSDCTGTPVVCKGTPVQTIIAPPPALGPNDTIVIDINVMSRKFGQYRFVERMVSGAVKGPDSVPSDIWERTPGAPSNLLVK